MTSKRQLIIKRKRSASPNNTETVSNELYFVYEPKRRFIWSNFKHNDNYDDNLNENNSENRTTKELKSLFKICLTFIAKHVECVENFNEFPSQIGYLIFKECIQHGRFNFNEINFDKEEQSLKLFAKAYPDLIGSSFNLNSNPILFSYLSNIMKFCFIKCLDLSSCNLMIIKNEKNLLEILGNSMDTLEALNLSNNCLDEEFIKMFTLSQRLNLANFSRLMSLNLTRNFKLQPECLKYFCNLKKLNEIFLSVDKYKEFESSVDDSFRICSCDCSSQEGFFDIKNDGWLKDVIESKINMSYKIQNNAVKGKFQIVLKISKTILYSHIYRL